MYISDYIGAPTKGHKHFDFVDSNIDGDNRLFIDPCMIEGADDPWSKNAAHTMQVFFDCMFEGFRNNTIRNSGLFDHAGEQNATKLGYGNGYNGKGKTADGADVFDDYAHHPTEIKATLSAAKNIHHNKLWCLFQPHTYTRTRDFMESMALALSKFSITLITEIYGARELPIVSKLNINIFIYIRVKFSLPYSTNFNLID